MAVTPNGCSPFEFKDGQADTGLDIRHSDLLLVPVKMSAFVGVPKQVAMTCLLHLEAHYVLKMHAAANLLLHYAYKHWDLNDKTCSHTHSKLFNGKLLDIKQPSMHTRAAAKSPTASSGDAKEAAWLFLLSVAFAQANLHNASLSVQISADFAKHRQKGLVTGHK